jgi:hypothetical protein
LRGISLEGEFLPLLEGEMGVEVTIRPSFLVGLLLPIFIHIKLTAIDKEVDQVP